MRFIRTALVCVVAALPLACGSSSYANDWSEEQCIVAKASVLMNDGDGIGEYTVHCCAREGDDGAAEDCRG